MRIIELQHMYVQLRLALRNNVENQNITFSLMQGSGFISAVYSNLTLRLESKVSFRSFEPIRTSSHIHGFRFQLEDGTFWLLYALPFPGSRPLNLCRVNQTRLESDVPYNGLIQLTKVPRGSSNFEEIANKCAGTWATSTNLSASFDPGSPHCARYELRFCLHPMSLSKHLLMYALPHHIQSFTKHMGHHIHSSATMQSTTKGVMTAVVADCWHMEEPDIPQNIHFSIYKEKHLDHETKHVIISAAEEEAQGDPSAESNLDSMYFSGKALDKYACLCWVAANLLHQRSLAEGLLNKLKQAFARFANNQQRFPLVYESELDPIHAHWEVA
jgi:endo-1,3(4)-beta-glucanase